MYVKAAVKALQDGKCADQGYTVKTGTQTKTYPVIGDIVITIYTKTLATQSICSLFQIADGTCGQSDLDCAYTMYVNAAVKALQDGKCDKEITNFADKQNELEQAEGKLTVAIAESKETIGALADEIKVFEAAVVALVKIMAEATEHICKFFEFRDEQLKHAERA